ncbi:hypothetical protein [Actinoplanes sp. GCM10030250]|uniref:hypothetical protein n=1 Tax=Actinoplanes sp. GCM10030250 TaxID=3273376 RepID=UPI00360D159A
MPAAVHRDDFRRADYAVTIVDDHGRVAAAALFQKMDWTPGDLIAFTVNTETVVTAVRATSHPVGTTLSRVLRRRGHLHIPANIRHRAGITAGDRLLLTADDNGLLRIFPAQLLAHMLHPYLTPQQP